MFKILFLIFIFVNSSDAGCLLNPNLEDCQLRYKNFFDFGLKAGDVSLTKTDDHFVFVQLPSEFKFFDNHFNSLYLSSNGAVELRKKNDTFELHNKFNYNSVSFPIADHAIIAPYWSDHIYDTHGEIFYRVTNDFETLAQISYDVNMQRASTHGVDFMPTWSSIITWYKLKAFNHRRFDDNCTFQLVLASDGEASYAMFNYAQLDWPNKKVNVSVNVGYNLGDNKTFFQIEQLTDFKLTDLSHSSNIGMRSRWMYRVDSHKTEIMKKNIKSKQQQETNWFIVLLVLIILVGLNSLINSILWIKKYFGFKPAVAFGYNKQLNESKMVLNQLA